MCYDKKDGMYFFTKFIVGDMTDIGYPQPFRYNSLLRRWEKLVKNSKKICIMSARGHGKSVYFSEILNLYDMFLFSHRRIIIISASQEQANRILGELKTIIENNEWLVTKKSNTRWAVETIGYNKGYILVKGIGSEILGEHVDRIVIDDILRSDSKVTDQQVEDYIDMTLDPMLLNRNGQMIIVGTPKRENDIFATIMHRIKIEPRTPWKFARYPAILDYEKKILQCPDRFTWREIINKRLSMGPLKFAREYQLEFFSRETSLFPKEIVDPAKDKGAGVDLLTKADIRPATWRYVMGVDVARSGAVSADFTVCIVIAHNTITNAKQIVHMWREKGMKIRDQAERIAYISKKFLDPYCLVEQNNVGQDMIDELVDVWNVNVDSFITGSRGQKKDDLIRFLITAFEYEQIVIPRQTEYSRDQMDILEDELSKFCRTVTPAGNERFEGVGAHDDTVIALALANKATQIGGTPFAIQDFGGDNNDRYGDGFGKAPYGESDLVNKILMGILQ